MEQKNGADTRGQQQEPQPEPSPLAQVGARVDAALAAAVQNADPLIRLNTSDVSAVLTYCNGQTAELQKAKQVITGLRQRCMQLEQVLAGLQDPQQERLGRQRGQG